MQTAIIIDGFNFYHSIKPLPRQFRWFDYLSYCHHFLRKNDIICSINYCTALAEWRPESAKRHRIFIKACEAFGIKTVLGKFKRKSFRCEECGADLFRHEEKETDVNIALTAYRLAAKHEQIIIVSGDSDLIPALRAIKEDYCNVRVGIIFPYNRHTRELEAAADFHHKTKKAILDNFLLPTVIWKPEGEKITCPDSWR